MLLDINERNVRRGGGGGTGSKKITSLKIRTWVGCFTLKSTQVLPYGTFTHLGGIVIFLRR